MKALTIDGYELVISAISENLTHQEAIDRLAHNLREPTQAKKIGYLRRKSSSNNYFIKNQFGNLIEISNHTFNKDEINKMVNESFIKFRQDYEAQKITDKNGNQKAKRWQKKMTPFTEILLTFGTTRPKRKKEGLNQRESNFINCLNLKNQAQKFANMYCQKYGVECVAITQHNDEKTMHYQIIFENYNLSNYANEIAYREDTRRWNNNKIFTRF